MKRSSGKHKVRVWVFRTVLLLGMLAVLFAKPISSTGDQVNDTATITNYEASLVLSKNGDLSTQEVITTDLPPNKRGIFRIFDTADPRRSGWSRARRHPPGRGRRTAWPRRGCPHRGGRRSYCIALSRPGRRGESPMP